jgi:hypothetical protein
MYNNPGYYETISKNFPSYIPSPFESQIDVDLRRTFPEDPFFKNDDNLGKLKNVLLAYSRRNISIGYCQGFNFIVGRLLKIFDTEVGFYLYRKKHFGYSLRLLKIFYQ